MTRRFVTMSLIGIGATLGGAVALTAAVSTEPPPAFVSNIGAPEGGGPGVTVNTIGRPGEPADDSGDDSADDSKSTQKTEVTTGTSAPRRAATTAPSTGGTTPTSIDDHGRRGRGADDSTESTTVTAPKTTAATIDDHGGDSGNRGSGRGGSDDFPG